MSVKIRPNWNFESQDEANQLLLQLTLENRAYLEAILQNLAFLGRTERKQKRFRVQNRTDFITPSAMSMNYGNLVEAELSISRQFSGGDSLKDVRFVVHHRLPE